MIIVSLTSWVKRINYVKKVVESIMNNTLQPDRVYLNLSKMEFNGIELPKELEDYFNNDDRLVINWVEGENTKPMKKIFPILKYLDDDDIIIDTDDDIIFPEDLIQSRINDFKKYDCKYCITSNPKTSIGFNGEMKVISAVSLFTKKMLKNWERLLSKEIINTYNDDRTYLHLLWLNGYKNMSCNKYDIFELLEKYNLNLDYGICKNKISQIGKKYDMIMQKEYDKLIHKDINESFGYWNNEKSVAIIAIARLENDYINEWIGHHLNIGIDHIYIYDNSSSTEEKLSGAIYEQYLDRVTVIPIYDKIHYQRKAYKEAYDMYGNQYNYLIYIDIDEFIMLQKDKNIKDFIKRFPNDLECYRMNWEVYGDNEIINRDISSSVVKDFSTPSFNATKNSTTKSIIKGGLENIDFISVHYAIKNINDKWKTNLITYFGDMKHITKMLPINVKSINIHDVDYTYIKLNHYITKSLCEFICQKMRRPDAARNYDRDIDNDFFKYNTKTIDKIKIYNQSEYELKYFFYSPKNFENAGDYFNKVLIDKMYYCLCKSVKDTNPDIALCGSLLTHPMLTNCKYIVGCGLQNSKTIANNKQESYIAVRGRLTMERLNKNNISTTNIKFVDPGLMVSKIYDLKDISKKYKIGIIPHYIDEDMIKEKYKEYKIISMKTTDILSICRQIKECDIILSSSLHGIIFSHSLGIPAYHIELNPLQEMDNFKFRDYYSCYDRELHYENFKCDDFIIPFNKIIEYDKIHRLDCNPNYDEIIAKQIEFMSVLPFKKYLNKKFICGNMDDNMLSKTKDNIKNTKIDRLRKDIQKGNVIKVLTDTGYIWKRIK